jgi:predicted nucleotidyltransferase
MRAILRLDSGKGFAVADVARVLLRESEKGIREVLADLVAEDLLVQQGTPELWRCTDKARDLQWTSRKRLSRQKAEQLVADFLRRVQEVNADERYAKRVETVVIFGSVVSDRSMIGDIDLAVQFRPRFQDPNEQDEAETKARTRAVGTRNIVDYLCWPETEVKRALRARSTVLELHDMDRLEVVLRRRPNTPFKVLFGTWSPSPPNSETK